MIQERIEKDEHLEEVKKLLIRCLEQEAPFNDKNEFCVGVCNIYGVNELTALKVCKPFCLFDNTGESNSMICCDMSITFTEKKRKQYARVLVSRIDKILEERNE